MSGAQSSFMKSLELLKDKLPSLSQLNSVHKLTDYGYTSMITITSGVHFFNQGWGPLSIMDTKAEYEYMRERSRTASPVIPWKLLHASQPLVSRDLDGITRRTLFRVWEAEMPCPVPDHILQALPEESRTTRMRLIEPISGPSSTAAGIKEEAAATASRKRSRVFNLRDGVSVVSLPATGDHGYNRRTHLALPLLHHGVSSLLLEGPYYGQRKPAYQVGSKLRHVMDLFLLGRTTIEEGILLLNWLRDNKHAEKRGLTGLSMGGVHACLTASAYDGPVATIPCLVPHSAATPYCYGALSLAVDFHALAAKPPPEYPGMRKERFSTIAPPLYSAELPPSPSSSSSSASSSTARDSTPVSSSYVPPHLHSPPADDKPTQQEYLGAGAASIIENLLARAKVASTPSDPSSSSSPASSISSRIASSASSIQATLQMVEDLIAASRGSFDNASFTRPSSSEKDKEKEKADSTTTVTSPSSSPPAKPPLPPDVEQRVKRELWEVMHHYTAIDLIPPPKRPDAAVIVFANDDAYVDSESPCKIHAHYGQSELRTLDGGHVTSFVMHQPQFRRAILDGLERL